ncbi:MAG: DUF6391 domain-containing protein [Chloroflexota bacterium]
MGLLDRYPIVNIRRNHGLEHATIHILSEKYPNLSMVGRSDLSGFTLYGDVDTEDVHEASQEALQRMQAGEESLAVHPRCGTIIAVTGIMTGLAAFLSMAVMGRLNSRLRVAALPEVLLAATIAALFAHPVGLFVQENYTVTGKPGTLTIREITCSTKQAMTIHRVATVQP